MRYLSILLFLFLVACGGEIAVSSNAPSGTTPTSNNPATGNPVIPSNSGSTAPAAACGNLTCETGETHLTCSTDCADPGPTGPSCGNNSCETGETYLTCGQDCATPPPPPPATECDNGICESGETNQTCPEDCSPPFSASCGNRTCEANEITQSCPVDCPAPLGAAGARYDLGTLPAQLSALQWPALPVITGNEIQVTSATAFLQATAIPGARIRVTQSFAGNMTLNGRRDLEIVMNPGVSMGSVTLNGSNRRIHFNGGEYEEGITMFAPANPANYNEDILIERVMLGSSTSSAVTARGRRIAMVGCMTNALNYGFFSGQSNSEDLIVAGNYMVSSGAEATVRLISAVRTVTVENVLINGPDDPTGATNSKHNYRVHGVSDRNFAARNLLIFSGTMMGTMSTQPGDDIGMTWFNDNTVHFQRQSMFQMGLDNAGGGLDYLQASGNTFYMFPSRLRPNLCCDNINGALPPAWDIGGNAMLLYQEPPYKP